MSAERAQRPDVQLRRILPEEQIRAIVAELASAIERDHTGEQPLIIVALLKGAVVFLADLIRRLAVPLEIEMLAARSYDGTRRQPVVQIRDDVARLPLAGRDVLLLDCVLDSGNTLAAAREAIREQAPATLRSCVLIRKARAAGAAVQPEYVGADVPDVFVVGYGLDYRNRWRHLPYVAELPRHMAEADPYA